MTNQVTTRIYFIRHAQSDSNVRDERTRPLTRSGTLEAQRIAQILDSFSISKIYSSPFSRAVLTVEPLAHRLDLSVELREDLRERHIGAWVDDFDEFSRRQWDDFDYHMDSGESLRQAQSRNIAQVQAILSESLGKCIAIGTHGMALSLILNYYDPSFGRKQFEAIVDRMPWVILCTFHGERFVDWQEVNY